MEPYKTCADELAKRHQQYIDQTEAERVRSERWRKTHEAMMEMREKDYPGWMRIVEECLDHVNNDG